ncbi:nurim homolog isoform X2 [Aplysia californica]|nr:nurim homolog isoform X2 [Aplysia californica]
MSTRWFKDKLASWLYITVSERMIYVAATCACLLFTVLQWQSIPETYLWFVDTRERFLLWTFFFLCHVVCWFLLGLEILLMDCSEMLGISQVYRYHSSLSPPLAQKARKLREIYSRMRHPGSLLLTLMLWLHPLMTLDRLLLASVLTTYMIGRHSFEESHYEFAEKYFTVEQVERKSSSSVRYEYVREN